MDDLSKYTESELRSELDRRMRKARNAQGFVRCRDCNRPKGCWANRHFKQGVWRICKDYMEQELKKQKDK